MKTASASALLKSCDVHVRSEVLGAEVGAVRSQTLLQQRPAVLFPCQPLLQEVTEQICGQHLGQHTGQRLTQRSTHRSKVDTKVNTRVKG